MDEAEGITLTEHQRYWLKHIRACEASGKRITEYATENSLGTRAMYDGKRALVNLLRDRLLAYDVLQMDETPVQALKELGKTAQSKSYL